MFSGPRKKLPDGNFTLTTLPSEHFTAKQNVFYLDEVSTHRSNKSLKLLILDSSNSIDLYSIDFKDLPPGFPDTIQKICEHPNASSIISNIINRQLTREATNNQIKEHKATSTFNEKNKKEEKWEKILNTPTNYHFITTEIYENKDDCVNRIYVRITDSDDESEASQHLIKYIELSIYKSNHELIVLKTPCNTFPNNFPQTAEAICKDRDAMEAILTKIDRRPEDELKRLFEQAKKQLGDDFTIDKRNELLNKFDKTQLIHRGWFRCGIVKTASYRRVLRELRQDAWKQLRAEITQIKESKGLTPEQINNVVHEKLLEAKTMVIFAEHQNNFIWTGAWGRTGAVNAIDIALKKYPKSEPDLRNKML